MSLETLQKLRAKYPAYDDIPDQELARRIIAKYPGYRDILGDVASGAVRAESTTAPVEQPSWFRRQFSYLTTPQEREIPAIRKEPIRAPGIVHAIATDIPRFIGEGLMTGGGVLGARIAGQATGEALRRAGVGIAARRAAPALARRMAEDAERLRFSLPALPSPGRTFRPSIVTPPPTPPEVTALGAQRAGNVGAGMIPPHLRQPALPVGGTRPRLSAPPPMFSQQRLVRPRPIPPPSSPVEPPQPAQSQQILFPVGGGAPVQRASQFHAPRVILNRVFGGGTGDKIGTAETVEARLLGPRNVVMRQAGITRLSGAEDRNLLQVLEGRAQPVSQRVAALAQQFRQISTEDAADYTRLGARIMSSPTVRNPQTGAVVQVASWRPFQPIRNYAPRMLDARRVDAMDVQTLMRDLRASNAGMSAQDAADIAVALKAQANGLPVPGTANPNVLQLVQGQSFLPTHLHARTPLTLPDSVLKPMREAIPIYLEQAARERAFLQTFGPQADEAIVNLVGQLGPRNPDVKLAEQAWDVYRGRFIETETGRRQKQTAHILNNLATALLLGPQTAISQLSQFAPLIGRLGLGNVARGMAKVMFQGGKIEAERAGAFVNSLRNEIVRVSQPSPTATPLDVVEQATGRFAGAVVRLSGIKTMDEFPRAVGYHAARVALEDARNAAVLGNARGARLLSQVGLNAQSTTEEIVQKSTELARRLNVTANFADLPFILQTPIGAFARGLNTFNIQATRLLKDEFLIPAMQYAKTGGKKGHLGLLRLLASGIVAGEAIGEARRAITGRRSDRPGGAIEEFASEVQAGRVPTAVLLKRTIDALGWAGTIGIVQGMWQSQFAQSPGEKRARILGTVAGAGVSQAGEIATTAIDLAQAPFASEKARKRQLRTAGRVFTRRIPVVGGIVAPRLFPPKK